MKRKNVLIVALCLMISMIFAGCDRTAPELSGIDKNVEVLCGADLNLHDYLNEHMKIKDETDDGTKEYQLKDLEYSIDCDDSIYDDETGKIDTDNAGDYDVAVTVKDEAGNKSTLEFKLVLNPLEVEKGFYIYDDSDSKAVMGFASYKNRSKTTLKITGIEIEYQDKDGTTLANEDDTDFITHSRDYIKEGETGYVLEDFVSTNISNPESVTKFLINVKYEAMAEDDEDNSLIVKDVSIKRDYAYDVSGFAGTVSIENPSKKTVEYCTVLTGMYDKDGKLIGVMESMDTPKIRGNSKAILDTVWLPESKKIPDKTKSLKGSARTTSYEGED